MENEIADHFIKIVSRRKYDILVPTNICLNPDTYAPLLKSYPELSFQWSLASLPDNSKISNKGGTDIFHIEDDFAELKFQYGPPIVYTHFPV